jgi:ankyrin repeat protein
MITPMDNGLQAANLKSLLFGASVSRENLDDLFLGSCSAGKLDDVKRYLKLGVDPDVRDSKFGYSGRHYAARQGHLHVLEFLHEDNDAEDRSKLGYTPMHLAAFENRSNVVKWYVDKQYDVNSYNSKGSTCLHLAALADAESTVKYLLSVKGILINPKDSTGAIPLHYAAKEGNLEILKLLLDNGGDLHAVSDTGANLLYLAVEPKEIASNASPKEIALLEQKTVAMTNFLMNKGKFDPGLSMKITDFESKDSVENTILDVAAEAGIAQVGKMLLGHPRVQIKESVQQAALVRACGLGKIGFAQVILDKKQIDINQFIDKKNGFTVLHLAASIGDVKVIDFLLKNGADYTVKTLKGTTAEKIALNGKCFEAANHLKKIDDAKKAEKDLFAVLDSKATAEQKAEKNRKKRVKQRLKKAQQEESSNTEAIVLSDIKTPNVEKQSPSSPRERRFSDSAPAKKLVQRVVSFTEDVKDAIEKMSPPSSPKKGGLASPKKTSPVKDIPAVESKEKLKYSFKQLNDQIALENSDSQISLESSQSEGISQSKFVIIDTKNRPGYKKSSIFLYENESAGTYMPDHANPTILIPVPEILDNVGSRLAKNHYKNAQYSEHVNGKRKSKTDAFHNFPDSVENNHGHWFHTVVTDFRLHPASKAYWEKQLGKNEVENCWFELKSEMPARINMNNYPAEKAERLGPNGRIEGVILASGLSKDDKKSVVHLCFKQDK